MKARLLIFLGILALAAGCASETCRPREVIALPSGNAAFDRLNAQQVKPSAGYFVPFHGYSALHAYPEPWERRDLPRRSR